MQQRTAAKAAIAVLGLAASCGPSAPPAEGPDDSIPPALSESAPQSEDDPPAEPAATAAEPVPHQERGNDAHPGPGDEQPAAEDKPGLPGANVHIGSMTVDGVTVKDLSCKTSGGGLGGLLGPLTLAAGISKRKAQLDACAPGGSAETAVHWHQAGGSITKVKAEGQDAKRNGCVERALLGAPAVQPAECKATVVHGK